MKIWMLYVVFGRRLRSKPSPAKPAPRSERVAGSGMLGAFTSIVRLAWPTPVDTISYFVCNEKGPSPDAINLVDDVVPMAVNVCVSTRVPWVAVELAIPFVVSRNVDNVADAIEPLRMLAVRPLV